MAQSTTAPEINTRLYIGAVSHRRLKPVQHAFKYRVFSGLFDIDELEQLGRERRWFSHNRWGFLSIYDKDHGAKDGQPLRPWIESELKKGGFDFEAGKILLHCFPRIFGLVFNPISVWFIYDKQDNLRAILHEVRNTFGEWRGYLLPVDDKRNDKTLIRQACDKTFYVSPLMEMNCHYNFTIMEPGERYSLAIRETQNGERVLMAAQTAEARPFSDRNILKTVFTHPLQYFKVILAIHFEAIRTMIKGAKYIGNPKKKNGDVTFPNGPATQKPPQP